MTIARSPAVRRAALVLAALSLAAVLLPLAAPRDPDAMPDTAALALLPPFASAYRVERRGADAVWAQRVEDAGETIRLERGPRTLEVRKSDLAAPVERAVFPFGTDALGRDLLSRCLAGARVSLLVAIASVLLSAAAGTAVGAVAGGFGGAADLFLMRLTDVFLSIPRLFLVLLLAALFARSLPLLVLALGLTGWMPVARQVRAQTLALREREFAVAAAALGASRARVAFRHCLPNAISPVLTEIGLRFGGALLAESSLSYLGIGVPPPRASWGTIIADGRDALASGWWISVVPGLCLVATVLAVNAATEGLRRATAPGAREAES